MMLKATLFILSIVGYVSAQLTQTDNAHLKKMAREQISSSLARHDLAANNFEDLESVVWSSQLLELLGDKYSSEDICKVVKKNQKGLLEGANTVKNVYYLAETYRLYKCEPTLKAIPEQVTSVLKKDVEKMSKVQNLHYAYLLNEGGKDYGQVGKIENFLASRVKDSLLPLFNQTDFSVVGSSGLSQDSLKALEIFASVQKSPEAGKEASALITSFIQKVSKQGVQTDNKFSFISKDVSPVALSKTVLSILNLSGNLDDKISKEQKVGLRNFFVQSASLSHKPCRGVTSIKGLSLIASDIPAVRLASD